MGFFDDPKSVIAGAINPTALLGTGISGGIDLWSGIQDRRAQGEANERNIQLARDQMAFQERMSSTAHQREVQDLMQAGLNPMLSANAGASSPSGSQGRVDPKPSGVQGLAASAKDSMRLAADMYKMKQDVSESKSRTRLNSSGAELNEAALPMKKAENLIPQKILEMFEWGSKKIKKIPDWIENLPDSRYLKPGDNIFKSK